MRVILFTGKGGVGKTSVAAATALRSMLDRVVERAEEPGKTRIEVQ